MSKYLVETFYTCTFKVKHFLDKIDQKELNSLEERNDGEFEVIDIKIDTRKTKSLEKNQATKNGMNISEVKIDKNEKIQILDESVSEKILPILRKIVTTKEGTASLENVDGYEIGGKTRTAQKSVAGNYSRKKINSFISVFPTSKPKFILAVMLDEPQMNSEYVYHYRDGSNIKYKGTPFNTSGWTTVEVTGQIVEKIGPILATKYCEIN